MAGAEGAVESCCAVGTSRPETPTRCPECGRPGRLVERITLKALLRPEALERLSAPEHRFCSTAECPVVYFGFDERFGRADVAVPVFQKEPEGARTVCYCLAITEGEIRRDVESRGHSPASERIKALVKAERCACELRNPQGSCCLGNVAQVASRAIEHLHSTSTS